MYRYYKIRYLNDYRIQTIRTEKSLKEGKYYLGKDGKQFLVYGKTSVKYTFDDIRSLIQILDGYNIGSIQNGIKIGLIDALREDIPAIQLDKVQRDCLRDIYYLDESLSNEDKSTLEKVLNIKKCNS